MPADRPNILIVMTDHQRWDTVLPEHPCKTPNVQRLIDKGVTFTQTHCPSPHCCPARASFHSGLYPSRHGVWNNICNPNRLSDGIHPDVRLWSSDLKDAGYDMHYTGKWHVDTKTDPADHGWTEYRVSAKGGALMGQTWDMVREAAQHDPATERGWGQIRYPEYPRDLHTNFGTNEKPEQHGDYQSLQDALGVLDSAGSGKTTQPWALYVGWNGPHDPYKAPKEFLDLYNLDDVPLPENYADTMHDKPNLYRRMREQIFGQWDEREVRDAIRHFWAYCSWLDWMFGQILDKLEATGQADHTIVLYCSDHGDYCGEHGLFAKGIPNFDGAYHVPAVVRWPKGVKNPGRRVDEFVSLCDFGPTFLEAAGITVDRAFSGRSLLPFLQDQTPGEWRDALFMQCNGVENYVTQRSIRTKDWHYTYNAFDFDELYDLRNDPHEMVNLAGKAEHREQVEAMCAKMWQQAYAEDDVPGNAYVTVALAPVGPVSAFRGAAQPAGAS